MTPATTGVGRNMEPDRVAVPETGVDPTSEIAIRPLDVSDAAGLGDLFTRLSPTTVYLRFFRPVRRPDPAALHHLAAVDHDHREAFAAVLGDRIVGVARYDREAEHPERAEIAVVIEDALQGHGVGTLLIDRLARRAHEQGVTTFTASVLGENTRMLSLARHLSPKRTAHIDHGEWDLEIPLKVAG